MKKHTHQCPTCTGFWTCYKECETIRDTFTFEGVEYKAGCYAKKPCSGCLDIRELSEWQKYTGAPPKAVKVARTYEKAWLARGGERE